MVFSSATFLCFFLPAVLLLSRWIRPLRAQNGLLLAASLVFYAFGRLGWLPILLVSAAVSWAGGQLVVRPGRVGRWALVGALTVHLAILFAFKYVDFALSIVNAVCGTAFAPTGIALPVGISFFTFQGMSYVIDVSRDHRQSCRSYARVLLYLALFPQLVAGPIVQYRDIADQFDHRTVTPEGTTSGLVRFTVGLSKKLILANALGQAADAVYALTPDRLDCPLAWLGAVCYTLQIYFDFSGYSDMAIGLGRVFGFRIRENFLHPYTAASIKAFWRRWHISLSSWFRDYVYVPLGGNRRGAARARANRLFVFFLTGLWHGANWTFVCWGLWHGLLLLVEDLLRLDRRLPRPIGHVYTMLAVTLGFMLFRAESLGQAGAFLAAMFGGAARTAESIALLAGLGDPILVTALAAGAVCALPLGDWLRGAAARRGRTVPDAVVLPGTLVLLAVDLMVLAASSFNPFIYFQF